MQKFWLEPDTAFRGELRSELAPDIRGKENHGGVFPEPLIVWIRNEASLKSIFAATNPTQLVTPASERVGGHPES